MWIHSDSISKPPSGSLQMLYMGGWIFLSNATLKSSMHEHCTDCQTLGRKSFSYSEGMPFSECPMALCTNALPLVFLLLDEVPRVLLSLRMLVLCYPVGGTVTLCQGCACWFPPAVAERIVASATLYLSSLRSFRGWEKITVFADDNAIN